MKQFKSMSNERELMSFDSACRLYTCVTETLLDWMAHTLSSDQPGKQTSTGAVQAGGLSSDTGRQLFDQQLGQLPVTKYSMYGNTDGILHILTFLKS